MLDDNLNKNQSSSAETKSFLLGNTINELNEHLIQSRKDEGNNIHTYDYYNKCIILQLNKRILGLIIKRHL
jgi:ribosomal protein S15P/S13E